MSANYAWKDTVARLLSAPRVKDTSELVQHVSIIDMYKPVLTSVKRKLNYRFMAAEALQILTGSNLAMDLTPYIAGYRKYTHDDRHIQWAYGPKVVEQICYCVEVLEKDCESRRAVMTMWRENPRWDDPPCTLSLQFLIRNQQFWCIATMRSSDIWLGWPYDVFAFTMIASYVQLLLQQRTGKVKPLAQLFLSAGSQHLYDRHRELASIAIKSTFLATDSNFRSHMYGTPEALLDDLRTMTRGEPPTYLPNATTIHHDTDISEEVHPPKLT